MHHHSFGDGITAGGYGLGRSLLHLDQTHPAIARDRQTLVIAEPRNLDPSLLRRLQDGGAVGDVNSYSVDGDFGHYVATPPPSASTWIRETYRLRCVLPSAGGNAGSIPGSARPRHRPTRRSYVLRPDASLAPAYRSRPELRAPPPSAS